VQKWIRGLVLTSTIAAASVSLANADVTVARKAARGAGQAPLPIVKASFPLSPESPPPPIAIGSAALLGKALQAARTRQLGEARRYEAMLTDPVARKLVDWAVVDVMADEMSASELEAAIRRLDGWPREDARREALARARLPPGPVPYTALADGGDRLKALYREHKLRMNEALERGDAAGAYAAIAGHGQVPGSVEYAEGESFAGWLALTKLRDPKRAEQHFARLDAAVKSPVSKARAAYWRGRTAERLGRRAEAQAFYEQGAVHSTTFYGQLAAEKAGRRELVLDPDPTPSPQDRRSFAAAELTRAIRLLAAADERRLVRVFALHYGDQVKSREELVLLIDDLQALGEKEVSLLAYRRAGRQGLVLHERGYPLMTPPAVSGGAEPALVLAVTRRESQFDPRVRSSADARGMMQILPATGRRVAREIGVSWSDDLLWDAHANMRLGARYLGRLVAAYQGSYPMAAAGYNAGPRRPPQWAGICGDPRASTSDALDFIECIPFGETRNYVMNVMANYQMYRARLGHGRAPLTAAESLKRVPGSTNVETSPSEAQAILDRL
jgi:soluble lytic murein transglycosylase